MLPSMRIVDCMIEYKFLRNEQHTRNISKSIFVLSTLIKLCLIRKSLLKINDRTLKIKQQPSHVEVDNHNGVQYIIPLIKKNKSNRRYLVINKNSVLPMKY